MKIENVVLMGAGAVGAYFIYGLSEKMGDHFCLTAEGTRRERLIREGVTINGKTWHPAVKTAEEAGHPDLLLIATKYSGLRESLDTVRRLVGENTLVLSVLNGIDSEEIVGEAVGREHVMRSFMRIISARKEDGIRFDPDRTSGVFFGEEDGQPSERTDALERLFTECGVHYRHSRHIVEAQWKKFGINISGNLTQAVFGVGYGAYFDSEHVAFIQKKLVGELIAVAAAEGVTVTGLPLPASEAPFAARFSTLQDLDAGRKTEIDMFLGVLIERAGRHGIEVPYSEYTYHAIKALEEKNEGKFTY